MIMLIKTFYVYQNNTRVTWNLEKCCTQKTSHEIFMHKIKT